MGRLGLCLLFLAAIAFSPAVAAARTVNVLYAGSLVNLMEHSLGPAFAEQTGDRFRGYAGGSSKLANEIKGELRHGDVFISANPNVDARLMGQADGNWVGWYISFAHSPLVIGYNPASRFAAAFKAKPWYQVLREPGIRIGRTDPKLDPKGRLTITLMKRAAAYYKVPGLARDVLGPAENPEQVLPEEELIGRLQSGEIDAGFFYSTETTEAKIPAIRLPPEITPKAVYTVTILRGSPDPAGARDFLAFLLGSKGRKLLQRNGLLVVKPKLIGKAPPAVSALLARLR